MIDLIPQVLTVLKGTTFTYPVSPDNIREEGSMRLDGFPSITVTETINEDRSSIQATEKLTRWGCQVDVYAKNIGVVGRRVVARTIANEVDAALKTEMLMRRSSITTMPYDDDTTRYVLRFDCNVTDKAFIHRTT